MSGVVTKRRGTKVYALHNVYGALYNGYAATYNTGGASIAPVGWHVPNETEPSILVVYLDPDGTFYTNTAGGELKEIGTTHWNNPNTGANNASKFTALGSGERLETGEFTGIKQYHRIWSPNQLSQYGIMELAYGGTRVGCFFAGIGTPTSNPKCGKTIRLIKDSTILSNGQTSTMTDYDGNIYPTVCIGTQEWMALDLKVKHYNDGTLITVVTDDSTWAGLTTGAMCFYNNDENYNS